MANPCRQVQSPPGLDPRSSDCILSSAPACDSQVPEPSWLAALRAGDPVAERAFYETHVEWVYRLAVRITREPDLARDLTQETFIRAFERLAQFRGEAPIGVWLRQVAMSVILNGLARVTRRRQREVAWADSGSEALAVVDPTAEPALQGREIRTQLAVALAALSPALRGVVLLHDVEGYSHAEIAVALGISVHASKVRLLRARTRLRASLAEVWETWQGASGAFTSASGGTSACPR